jgi:O-antigen/teichoic acid export membrane protein
MTLSVAMLVTTVANYASRYFISYYCGEASLGIYTVQYFFVAVMMITAGAVGSALSPRLAQNIMRSRQQYLQLLWRVVLVFMGMAASGAMLCLIWADTILRTTSGEEFAGHRLLLMQLLVGGIFLSASGILDFGMVAARQLNARVAISTISLGLTILTGIVAFPQYGLNAAGMMMITGAVSLFIGYAFFSSRRVHSGILTRGHAQQT